MGGRGGGLDPRGSVIRGPPTTLRRAVWKPSTKGCVLQFSVQYCYLFFGALGLLAIETHMLHEKSPRMMQTANYN